MILIALKIKKNKIYGNFQVSISGEIGKVDAMTSDWVANRLLFVSTARVMQLPLDAIQVPFYTIASSFYNSLINDRMRLIW